MKKIKLLTDQKIHFSIGDTEVELSENMPIEVAEMIADQYPGQYLAIETVSEKKRLNSEN